MSDDSELIAERREKLSALRRQGTAYPNDFRREHLASELHEKYGALSREELDAQAIPPRVAGRLMLKRVMGKLSFGTLQDMSGRIQLYVSDSDCGTETHARFKSWDLGDIVGAAGTLFKTKTGELSVRVKELRLLAKALRPLPEKFHGLADQEAKYRQRYLDLVTNEETRKLFATRSTMIQALREFLVRNAYIEVETPMMHPIPGGAAARPFITHHNALDMDLYLRIAPELYLKRLVIGGFEKVFEINRSFRNEGISTRHNPEFTMLEFYCAYEDYRYLMDFIEAMLREVTMRTLEKATLTYQGREVDLAQPFARFSIVEALQKFHPDFTNERLGDRRFLMRALDQSEASYQPSDSVRSLQLTLFEASVEEQLMQPTFITDYPAEASPLARRSDANPEIAERFELYIAGREIANGFSELNDPEDQAARFAEQARQKQAGNEEAMHYDADYIRALEYGLPPTAGAGIGIDRLAMLFTDSPSIRDVILFPQLRRED